MKLDSLVNYRTANSAMKIITIIAIVFAFVFSVWMYLYSLKELKASKNKIYMLDAKGNAYAADEKNIDINTRAFEYEAHVKTFYNLWYSIDENSYKRNIDDALNLAGECGKEMYNEYKEQDLLNTLRSKNLSTTVEIKEIKIEVTQRPITGYIKGIQTIKRLGGEISRNMNCTFQLHDVDRSRENPHGVKIENWKVIDNSEIDKSLTEQQNN